MLLTDIKELLERCKKINIGFGEIVLTLKFIGERGIGRYKLKSELDIGEATARTLLKHLRELGFIIRVDKTHILTKKGVKIFNIMKELIKDEDIIETPYKLGKREYFIHLRNMGGKVKRGVEQRDMALLSGGKGAITLIYKDKGLVFPDSGVLLRDVCPELDDLFVKREKLVDNDVIIIVGANTRQKSRIVAYSIITTFIG